MRSRARCPHCSYHLGGEAIEGDLIKVRVKMTLVDPVAGRVMGPCPGCDGEVVIFENGALNKSLLVQTTVGPGLAIRRRRRVVDDAASDGSAK